MALTSIVGLPCIPIATELAIECTYPFPEALSYGLMSSGANLFGFIFGIVNLALATDLTDDRFIEENSCNFESEGVYPKNFTLGMAITNCVPTLICILITLFFKCDFKRQNLDLQGKTNEALEKEI